MNFRIPSWADALVAFLKLLIQSGPFAGALKNRVSSRPGVSVHPVCHPLLEARHGLRLIISGVPQLPRILLDPVEFGLFEHRRSQPLVVSPGHLPLVGLYGPMIGDVAVLEVTWSRQQPVPSAYESAWLSPPRKAASLLDLRMGCTDCLCHRLCQKAGNSQSA